MKTSILRQKPQITQDARFVAGWGCNRFICTRRSVMWTWKKNYNQTISIQTRNNVTGEWGIAQSMFVRPWKWGCIKCNQDFSGRRHRWREDMLQVRKNTVAVIPRSPQLQALVSLSKLDWGHTSGECVKSCACAVRAVEVPVLVCVRSSGKHVTEVLVGGP